MGERKSAVGQSYGMTEGIEGGGGSGKLRCKSESDGQTEKKEECSGVRRDHTKDRMGGRFWAGQRTSVLHLSRSVAD